VIQSGGQADLALEAFRPEGRRQLGVKQLERHRTIVAQVAREVDGSHPAATELALDEVAITECCGQRGVDCGHQSCRVGNGLNLGGKPAPSHRGEGAERRYGGRYFGGTAVGR
jgi:hypothetical protein